MSREPRFPKPPPASESGFAGRTLAAVVADLITEDWSFKVEAFNTHQRWQHRITIIDGGYQRHGHLEIADLKELFDLGFHYKDGAFIKEF